MGFPILQLSNYVSNDLRRGRHVVYNLHVHFILQAVVAVRPLRLSASISNMSVADTQGRHTKQQSMRKLDYGVALYPPPEVGGFTATSDKDRIRMGKSCVAHVRHV